MLLFKYTQNRMWLRKDMDVGMQEGTQAGKAAVKRRQPARRTWRRAAEFPSRSRSLR